LGEEAENLWFAYMYKYPVFLQNQRMMKKQSLSSSAENHIAVFQETTIRRTWHNEEWWFAVVDVVAVLTDSVQPEGYVKDLRHRDPELAKGWGQIATLLQIQTNDGAQRINCANTEGLFRIIQSIPSPKAEPFKRWLAQVGYERVKEIENPELASARARELYQAKGYPQAWIEKRLRSISVRGELTDEWKARTGFLGARRGCLLRFEAKRSSSGRSSFIRAVSRRIVIQ
jgi:DNA-damage-inducible protein D